MTTGLSDILDFKRPHTPLGEKDEFGYSWYEQDGALYAWSESNVRFERAWWLDEIRVTPLVKVLRRERPDPRKPKKAAE